MTDPKPDDAGWSRDEDLEDARHTGRPAEADMDADAEAAARDPLMVSPDPDDETDGDEEPTASADL